MNRFVAFLWDPSNQVQADTANRLVQTLRSAPSVWQILFQSGGLSVLERTGQPGQSRHHLLAGSAGVVVGTLFGRSDSCSNAVAESGLDEEASRRIIVTGGQSLLEDYWGRYVAFLYDDGPADRRLVLCDPSGQLPCYHTRIDGIDVYLSDLSDLPPLLPARPAANWPFLMANLTVRELSTRQTGLEGVSELFPGEYHERRSDTLHRGLAWVPAHHCRQIPQWAINDYAAELRQTVQDCVTAWGSVYGGIIHTLSGGLDSSIVLACLEAAPNDVLCVNYRTAAGSEGDERDFARLAARHAGRKLTEIEMPPAASLSSLLAEHPLSAVPDGGIFGAPTKWRLAEIARERRVQAFTSGEGGDHLFYQMATPLVAADYVWDHGFTRALPALIQKTARWTGQTAWRVLRDVALHGVLRRPAGIAPRLAADVLPFVAADMRASLVPEAFSHPWAEYFHRIPPGKAHQIAAMLHVLRRRDMSEKTRAADIVDPLLSQPLIELVLRIPSYVLTWEGQSRGLARLAFVGEVPPEILARTTKGGTTGHFAGLLRDHFEEARGFLLDGLLSQAPVMDRKSLEAWLTIRQLQNGESIPRLFKLLASEAWLRAWQRAFARESSAA